MMRKRINYASETLLQPFGKLIIVFVSQTTDDITHQISNIKCDDKIPNVSLRHNKL